jgi:hypothetical protein
VEQQAAARGEAPGDLSIEGAFVGDIHLHVLGPDHVE